jgi:hypothetical protein
LFRILIRNDEHRIADFKLGMDNSSGRARIAHTFNGAKHLSIECKGFTCPPYYERRINTTIGIGDGINYPIR